MKDLSNAFVHSIDSCENEPIHIPGSIQPFGYLIAIDHVSQIIMYCSANIQSLINKPLADVLGTSIHTVIADFTVQRENLKENIRQVTILQKSYYLTVHAADTTFILELEPISEALYTSLVPIDEINTLLYIIQSKHSSQ